VNDLAAALLARLSAAVATLSAALERRPEPLMVPVRADDRRSPRPLGRRH
jgi:hypothetical protein